MADLALTSLNVGTDGLIIAHFRQFVHGVSVRKTRLDLVIADGGLFSLRTRLEPPSRLVAAPKPTASSTLNATLASVFSLLEPPFIRSREFDAARGTYVAVVEVEHELIDIDERNGEVLARRTETHPAAVTRLVKTANFGNGWDVDPVSPLLQQRNAVIDGVLLSGPPKVCEARLDKWASLSVGEPRMVPSYTSNTSVQQTYSVATSCSSNLPSLLYDHPITTQPEPADRRGIQGHAYFWTHDLAFFARSTEARLHAAYPFTNVEGLYVNANPTDSAGWPCTEGPACFSRLSGTARLNFGSETYAAFSLGTIAHEYGHFIASSYGFRAYGALQEGVAMSLQLRYGRYRAAMTPSRPHDSAYTSAYSKFSFDSGTFGIIDHRASQRIWRGQWLPDYYDDDPNYFGYPEAVTDNLRSYVAYSETAPHPCATPNQSTSIHACGSVVGSAYWTLAHNQMRVSYFGVPEGTTLTNPVSPYTSAALADLAFTYALQLITDSSTILDFFDAVEERYVYFRTAGFITATEQNKVQIAGSASISVHFLHERNLQFHQALVTDVSLAS